MAIITCPECEKEVSDKAMSCPSCGFPIREPDTTIIEESFSKNVNICNRCDSEFDVSLAKCPKCQSDLFTTDRSHPRPQSVSSVTDETFPDGNDHGNSGKIWLVLIAILSATFCIWFYSTSYSKMEDDVSLVRNGYLPFDKTITVGQAFDGYKYFTSKKWEAFRTEQGRRVVQFTGTVDMNCSAKPEAYQLSKEMGWELLRKTTSAKTIIQFRINADNTFFPSNVTYHRTFDDQDSDSNENGDLDRILKRVFSNDSFPPGVFIDIMGDDELRYL